MHAKKLRAMRWGQQFRFFRDEVIEAMQRIEFDDTGGEDENSPGDARGEAN